MTRELLFSVAKKDFEIQTFPAGGPGGQHQNKTASAVRVIHRASGAVGESREQRSQMQNRKTAFLRCVQSPKFQAWHKRQVAVHMGDRAALEQQAERWMDEKNLKVETF